MKRCSSHQLYEASCICLTFNLVQYLNLYRSRFRPECIQWGCSIFTYEPTSSLVMTYLLSEQSDHVKPVGKLYTTWLISIGKLDVNVQYGIWISGAFCSQVRCTNRQMGCNTISQGDIHTYIVYIHT